MGEDPRNSSWQFRPMAPGELNIDPVQDEFFATEALAGITDVLVREAIQNSIDAAAAGTGVVVRFQLVRAPVASASAAQAGYLAGLEPHFAARRSGVAPLRASAPLAYLVVEDFGTRGLEGDPAQCEDAEDEGAPARNDFYYFWRNIGRSVKGEHELGRWGLGKTVFPAASAVHTFFGLTVRQSDGRSLLMGQAALRIHSVAGRRYAPYGFFGHHRAGLCLPVEEPDAIQRFASAFGLRRNGEPGLSVVVPYPDREIDSPRLLDSVLQHYFAPLVAGTLVVEVADGDGAAIRLDRDSIESYLRRTRRGGTRESLRLLRLARWGLEPPAEARAAMQAPPAGAAPKMVPGLLDADDLARLRRRFEAGDRVAVEVGVPVERAGAAALECPFTLLMERDDELGGGEGHFVRQGITIANASAPRPRGTRWILSVTDPALSAFLGDAENPAHTEWQRHSAKMKRCYVRGPSTLAYVKAAPRNVLAILSRPAQGRDPDLLRSLFSLLREAAAAGPDGKKRAESPGDASDSAGAAPPELRSGGRLVLSRVDRGFKLAGSADSGDGALRLEVEMAYEVRRGNPFRHWSPHDFRVEEPPISVRATGGDVVILSGNRIEVAVRRTPFEVIARGFDPRRDLRVRVRERRQAE
ncbi:MAG: hypothetical protein JXQ29_13100 [Planctomycetes bacterium]|nr:hypothetical protein [Planctomycetota bacterium]